MNFESRCKRRMSCGTRASGNEHDGLSRNLVAFRVGGVGWCFVGTISVMEWKS